jgi:hypothetical protein
LFALTPYSPALPQTEEQASSTEDFVAEDTIAKHNLFFFGIITITMAMLGGFGCKSISVAHVCAFCIEPNLAAQGRS